MKRPSKRWQILLAVTLLLYACGYLTQFIGNYAVWQKNGGMPGGTSPPFSSLTPLACLKGILWFPYSLYCMAGCAAAVAAIFLYRKLFSQDALTDSERNFDFSAKGTYGTSGWMQPREIPAVLNIVSDLSQHTGTVLGILDGRFLCIPEKTRMNGNLAVYGASGSMKTRSFCMNRILQSAARGESLIICDPKSELYEKSSEYMRVLGYTVRVFNLVSPENSDSWNCLKEIEGQELMAQLFVDVIIKNTNGTGKSDRFWDSGEMNLLKALVLYVDLTYPPEQRNIGEVYNLITQCSESQLDSLFDVLPLTHPAKAPYSLYQRASDSVRSGVISGLGSRLQVFQSELIKKITAYDEISLELPGQQPCAYYLVTSDQDSTFDFLASLFLSFAFIKLVRYADANCPGGRLPVPVHVLGEELTACGTISELSRRISVIRSRNISMSCVFQNLAGLQNRYKEIQNKEKQNTDLILSESETVRTKVRDNIELDLLCRNQPESAPVMQEIYELVVETIQLRSPVLRLGNNLFPMALVRERLLQLTSEHIRFVLDGLRNLHTDVKNLKKYLLTMLFNAPVTLNGRTMLDVRKSVGGGSRPMLA